MSTRTEMLDGRQFEVYEPSAPADSAPLPLVFLHGDAAMKRLLEKQTLLPMQHCLAVLILSEDRLRDFTPWPAPSLHPRFPDFAGEVEAYLSWIRDRLLPEMHRRYPVTPRKDHIGLLGQSLGGLLNLSTACREPYDFWGTAACISPSSWYPGFVKAAEASMPAWPKRRWFISSGTIEGAGEPDIKATTVSQTRMILALLRHHGHAVTEVWDEGGHHQFLPERYARALCWLDRIACES